MPQENLEIVRRCYELWRSREFSRMPDLLDPGMELDLSRNVFNPRIYRGHEAFERLTSVIDDTWDDFTIEILELIDAGEQVVAAVKISVKGKQSGVSTEMRRFNVWTLRDGQVVRMVGAYQDRGEALEAAGLEE